MPKFLLKAAFTSDGAKGLLKEGGTKRRAAVEKIIEAAGGKLEAFYYEYGDGRYIDHCGPSGRDGWLGDQPDRQCGWRRETLVAATHYARRSRRSRMKSMDYTGARERSSDQTPPWEDDRGPGRYAYNPGVSE